MAIHLTKLHVVAISLTSAVFLLFLLLLTRLVKKRIWKDKLYRKQFTVETNLVSQRQQSSKLYRQVPVMPPFPYKELNLITDEYIQPSVFSDEVANEIDSGSNSNSTYAATLNLIIRYDVSRSMLIVVLSDGNNLFTSEDKANINYYITTKLFPHKHRSFQTCVHKTTTTVFNETFQFRVSLEYLLLQSLKFSLWSFDRFSHHEAIADGLLQLSLLEKYGLSICREIGVSQRLRLVPKASVICGEIFLSLGYLALAEKLAVIVVEVTKLSRINGKLPDPYVEVTLIQENKLSTKKATSIKFKKQHPKYNETLTFDVHAEQLHQTSLAISVLSKDDSSASDKVLGKVLLGPEASGENFDHWDDVRTASKPIARWHKLRKP